MRSKQQRLSVSSLQQDLENHDGGGTSWSTYTSGDLMVQGHYPWRPVDLMLRQTAPPGQRLLKGIPASPGISIGRAFVLSVESPSVPHEKLEQRRIPDEVARFRSALEAAASELVSAIELARTESASVSTIIESFLLIVSDPIITSSIVTRIETGIPAEAAVVQEFDVHKSILLGARDPILRERVQDFDAVKERLIGTLRNRTLTHAAGGNAIVVAGSVTPQDMLFFKQTGTLAYVTEVGGINSHACILARDMLIPAVIGIRNATGEILNGLNIVVDGYSGIVVVDPDESTLEGYRRKQSEAEAYRVSLGALRHEPTVTRDGHRVSLFGNVDSPDQVDAAVMAGCEGIGLVRTEYLLLHRSRYPSSDEQYEWYRDIAQRAYPLQVTFRAFDVGSDKYRDGIPHHEDNPALGLRGIRFLLYRPDIFREQIRAVLRASAHRNVRFMLPMVAVAEEFEQARILIDRCKRELATEGVEFDAEMPVGVMIETPSAAMMSDYFAAESDFLSIGTNDLAQYALATDRTNELVADIFDAMHPSVLRMIRMTVDAARRYGRSVSVCGELAGHAAATEMLVGMGLSELSVSPALLLEIRHRIRQFSYDDCVELVRKIERCTTTPQVHAIINGRR